MESQKRTTTKTFWVTRIIILFVVLVIIAGITFIWWNDGSGPVLPSDTEQKSFVVKKGESISSISSRLEAEKLIRSKTIFFITVKLLDIDNEIQAGNFRLDSSMTTEEIARALTQGTEDIKVTTFEGWRVEEIAQLLSKELGVPEREFNAVAEEGYMFPDTYFVQKEASAEAIVNIFKNNFDSRVTQTMRDDAQAKGLSLQEVVTIASLVEREGNNDEDRPIIAGIILKRLNTPGWTLDIDATLQYALGYDSETKTWWKKYLTNQDKEINSPYNTYRNAGLPPTPISNPSLASINAVIYPQETDYWFYLHDNNGQIHYARTLEEHQANIDQHL